MQDEEGRKLLEGLVPPEIMQVGNDAMLLLPVLITRPRRRMTRRVIVVAT